MLRIGIRCLRSWAWKTSTRSPRNIDPFKQLIERLNRTYKYHVRSACGFATRNGAVAVTVLFVTFYNFLRSHMALNYRPPVDLPQLATVATLQGRWNRILEMAFSS